VSVWEPGLATAMASLSGVAPGPPSSEMIADINRVERDLAAEAADAGASLARELGATAEPIAITDKADVAAAITSEADRHDVCAISVGSRGLGRVMAPLLGSTRGKPRRTGAAQAWRSRAGLVRGSARRGSDARLLAVPEGLPLGIAKALGGCISPSEIQILDGVDDDNPRAGCSDGTPSLEVAL
jgi:hypothetical protein